MINKKKACELVASHDIPICAELGSWDNPLCLNMFQMALLLSDLTLIPFELFCNKTAWIDYNSMKTSNYCKLCLKTRLVSTVGTCLACSLCAQLTEYYND